MAFELIQQANSTSSLPGIAAQITKIDLQLRNQVIDGDLCVAGAGPAFLFIGNEVLTQDGDQQGLFQIQTLPAYQRVRPFILFGRFVLP